ncbi:MAG: DUF4293 domain-containing protein [Cytophagales bacterium]
MLQRIQSIFLALIAVAMAAFLFVNIWQKSSTDGGELVTLGAFQMIYAKDSVVMQSNQTYLLAALAVTILGIAIYSLLSFANRLRQLQLGLAISVLIAALLGSVVYYSFLGEKLIADTQKGSFGAGLLIPAMALILNSLANRFIRKDEEEVRSADRMR